jgi:uncharacterized protein
MLRRVVWSKQIQKSSLQIEPLRTAGQRILVTGGTGFIGRSLCQAFINHGHHVTILTRNMQKTAGMFYGRVTLVDSLDKLTQDDVFNIIINVAGEAVSQRWTDASQHKMLGSRIDTTEALIAYMQRANHKPSVFISASAIGIYATDETTIFTEDTLASQDTIGAFPRELCQHWERVATQADQLDIRTAYCVLVLL